jgi:para-nitrobenzyl esterase
MWAAALLCVSALASAGSVAAARTGVPAGSGAAALVVRTDKGPVRGVESDGAREFLGVPYAAPPVGPLRWRPPQPATRWRGIRNASKPGNVCAQTGSIVTGVPVTSIAENCLYLSVYTPAAFSFRPRPVMVWIHGGGFTGGAGSIFDGGPLAASGNVMVVTINYRLGPFGFLALPSLDAESPGGSSGDYGLMDQQAALRWVQRNARAFGGDPRDVTIFGESAGGTSACDNMASPAASGLFAHAIAESGCLQEGEQQQQAERQDASFAAKLGCANAATAAACLRGKPVTSLLAASASVAGGWAPVVGGQTLPLQPITAFTTGRYAHVPLLQGTNHDDERLSVGFEFGMLGPPMTAAQYPAILTSQFGAADAAKIKARYPLSAYPSPSLAYASVLTDSQSSCPALATDTLASRSGVYAYEFSDPNPPNDFGVTFSFPLGDAHSTELQYVFGKVPYRDVTPPFTPAQFTLSAQMMKYWSRFAATGNPNGGGAPYWPAFDPGRSRVQELTSAGITPEDSFGAYHQCAFWAQVKDRSTLTSRLGVRPG